MEWTCPRVHSETLQCTINCSPSSEVQFLITTQLAPHLSANFDNLPNTIWLCEQDGRLGTLLHWSRDIYRLGQNSCNKVCGREADVREPTYPQKSQPNNLLCNCAEKAVQNAIINTYPNFFTNDPDKILDMSEALVIQRSNPIVYRFAFTSMSQNENEPIQNYLVCLRAIAIDCNFTCSCEHDFSNIYFKDQFIRGMASDKL